MGYENMARDKTGGQATSRVFYSSSSSISEIAIEPDL